MKTKFFFFAMLVSIAASAQSHINIQMIGATYTASPAVKFRISWSSVPTVTGQTHNAKIWVWVDFLKVNADNTTTGNTWTRAEITATPAVTSSPTSTATLESGNNKGFWLNGVTGSYSATITAALSNIPANTKFNWCAYTSDCPPNVTAANGTYTFKGTPPFTLIASNGITTQTVSGKTLPASSLTITPTTIRDKTECPGVFCIYTGSDLYVDATHLCQQRTSGAKNWEAWIKDARDDNKYRIVLMPDQNWYMAQNLNYRGVTYYCYGNNSSNCNETNGVWYRPAAVTASLCPTGWKLPTISEWSSFITVNNLTNADVKSTIRNGNDKYGLTAVCPGHGSPCAGASWTRQNETEGWWALGNGGSGLIIYNFGTWQLAAGTWHDDKRVCSDDVFNTRCFRQL